MSDLQPKPSQKEAIDAGTMQRTSIVECEIGESPKARDPNFKEKFDCHYCVECGALDATESTGTSWSQKIFAGFWGLPFLPCVTCCPRSGPGRFIRIQWRKAKIVKWKCNSCGHKWKRNQVDIIAEIITELFRLADANKDNFISKQELDTLKKNINSILGCSARCEFQNPVSKNVMPKW